MTHIYVYARWEKISVELGKIEYKKLRIIILNYYKVGNLYMRLDVQVTSCF